MSKIIVIEGADRCGKFTQSNLLKGYIDSLGLKSTIVEVPIRSLVTYKVIYWMLHNGTAKRFPKIFQWFQFLNRKIFQTFTLPSLEMCNDVIIFDRWSLSTTVYGAAEGVPKGFTKKLADWLRKPDHTIILHGQSFNHVAEDVYEADNNLQRKVRALYAEWAANHPENCTLVNSRQSREVVHNYICSLLSSKGLLTMCDTRSHS
jgi:thymidylate kinase